MDPTQVTQYQTGFAPEIAPYAQNLLGQTYSTIFTPAKDASGKVIMDETSGLPQVGGFQPFQTYDTQDRFAQFTPLQQQSFAGAQGMAPSQYTQGAANMAGIAGLGALGTNYQGFNPATSGFNQGQTASNYMSPYMQNVVNAQQREAKRQSDIQGTQQQAQATQAGAFGGGRDAIMRAERERNLGTQLGDIQAKGLQDAYTQAMQQFNTENQLGEQSKQFGAGLGLQGLQTALQGANTMGALGQQQFTQGMDINKLQNQYGGQQQQQMQNMLNADYQQFLDKQNYPYKQLGFMSDMIRGLPTAQTGATMYQQPPNTLGQIAGLAQGFGSMMGKKDGGQIKAYAEGGSIANPSDGKLASMMDSMSDQQLQQIAKLSPMPQARRLAQEELQDRASMRMRSGGIVAFKEGGDEGEEKKDSGVGGLAYLAAAFPGLFQAGKAIVGPLAKGATSMAGAAGQVAKHGATAYMSPATSATLGGGLALSEQSAKYLQQHPEAQEALINSGGGDDSALASAILSQARENQQAKTAKSDEQANKVGGGRGVVNPPMADPDAPMPKGVPAKSSKTGSGSGVVAAAANLAQSQGISKDDFMDNVKGIMGYLSESSSKELDNLKGLISQNANKADEVRADAQRKAMMNFGFNMAAKASERGTGSGLAGALRAASAASPSIAASMEESQKLAQQMEDNQRQLQIELAKYSVSMRKGDERTAIGLASNIRQLQQQQAQLAEQSRHNKASEGMMGARIAAMAGRGQEKTFAPILRGIGSANSQANKIASDLIKSRPDLIKPGEDPAAAFERIRAPIAAKLRKEAVPMFGPTGKMYGAADKGEDDDMEG
jgi:hypothetical protein